MWQTDFSDIKAHELCHVNKYRDSIISDDLFIIHVYRPAYFLFLARVSKFSHF